MKPERLVELAEDLRRAADRLDAVFDDDLTVALRIREAADVIEELDAEAKRAWSAYRIAHGQAMSNGAALASLRATAQMMKGEG